MAVIAIATNAAAGGGAASGGSAGGGMLEGSASLTPAGMTANTCADDGTTITVTGAASGDPCVIGTPAAGPGAAITASCFISATNTATVRFCNVGAGSPTPTAGTYSVAVPQ